MASPNATYTELATTTLHNYKRTFSDNVTKHNALLDRLRRNGGIRRVDGGRTITEPLDYSENSTYTRYSGLDVLNIGASEVFTSAEYNWKQAAVHVVISGLEQLQNSGKSAIMNLLKSRITNAERTAANNLSVDAWSAGSLANQIGGIQNIIQDAGTGTVGGINSSTYTWWKNQFLEATGTMSKSTIQAEMMTLWMQCVRGSDKPDMIFFAPNFYRMYWNALSDLQRFTSTDEGNTGFESLKFQTADVYYDTTESGCPTTHGYFLNTKYLKLCIHEQRDWAQMDDKMPLQQDALVIPLLFAGNMTCSNRARQGVLIDAS